MSLLACVEASGNQYPDSRPLRGNIDACWRLRRVSKAGTSMCAEAVLPLPGLRWWWMIVETRTERLHLRLRPSLHLVLHLRLSLQS